MKICVISSLFTPYKRGGAEVIAQKTVSKLKAMGHEVFVVSTGYKDAVEEVSGVKVYRVAPHNIFSYIDIQKQPFWKRAIWHILDQWNYSCATRVKEIVNQEKPDIVLVHALKGLGYLIPKYLSNYDKPVIFTLHDVQLSVPSGLLMLNHEKDFYVNNPYTWVYTIFSKYLFSFAKNIVTPSQWLLDFYKERGFFKKSNNLVLRNPIDLPANFDEKEFNFKYAFIGQIEEHKGIRLLLSAFEKFVVKYPQAELVIVGGGSLKEELEKKYNHAWVKFAGFVPYDELSVKIFNNISYSLLTSTCYENSPGTVYDGYANSTPVIVPKIGGSAELVEQGVTGFIFEPGNEMDLLAALENSVSTSNEYKKIARAGYDKIQEYSFEKYLDRIINSF